METKALKRSEVDPSLKWDLTHIYKTEDDYQKAMSDLVEKSEKLSEKYLGKLQDAQTIAACMREYRDILEIMYLTGSYEALNQESDFTDNFSSTRASEGSNTKTPVFASLKAISMEFSYADESLLYEVAKIDPDFKHYIDDIIREKPHMLSSETEQALAYLSPAIGLPSEIFRSATFADLKFGPFTADGKTYELSFNGFESALEYDPDTNKRRAAFEAFYKGLEKIENTMATGYQSVIQTETMLAKIRKYDSVFDMLLFDQKVTRQMYDRQIDLIYEKLAPHMRKYAKLIQKEYKLDKMTYADLKAALDPEYKPETTIEAAKDHVRKALSIMGDEYMEIINDTMDNRRIDLAQNIGKASGAFCAAPYGKGAFILMSWGGQMSDVFTLSHELGHAGHFGLSNKYQTVQNTRVSTYFVEAPSTMNELLLFNSLTASTKDERLKKWLTASLVGNTYYHNFVTHLLEAHYQRKVYKHVAEGRGLNAETLNNFKLETLRGFWGDAVEIPDYAGRTWMRQPHYYMGLYPYTYSAGLTISTTVSQKIAAGDKGAVKLWTEMLKLGSTKTPLELSTMVGADMSTDEPFLETIEFIGDLITSITAFEP